jgi:hyperosmotically inducible periplasmic protein
VGVDSLPLAVTEEMAAASLVTRLRPSSGTEVAAQSTARRCSGREKPQADRRGDDTLQAPAQRQTEEAKKKAEVDSMKRMAVTVALVGAIVVAGAVAARADVNDSWITTKAKIALLTTDGFSVNGANVDTINGNVTIHGKVATTADRTKAEQTVRKVDGVKTVNNLLQVVPDNVKKAVAANDSDVKERVEASLKADGNMKDVKVASVNNGLVLLSGKTDNLTEKLRAIENAYSVNGVHRVASEIQAIEN